MPDRREALRAFLLDAGCDPGTMRMVAGDASNRAYWRLDRGTGPVIAMDAPPEKGEDVRPFVRIATWLRARGLSAPEVFEAAPEQGFLLLEDLGDGIYARLFERGVDERSLYRAAMDVLRHIARQEPPDIGIYDANMMAELAGLAFDWYRAGVTGTDGAALRQEALGILRDRLAPLAEGASTVILRDYHAENLIWLPERSGLARVGLLDFQDALLGHPAYDLTSILEDARRDVPEDLAAELLQDAAAASGSPESFARAYHLLGVQRNLRILGVFARLALRDGKPRYVALIPRVWGHITRNLDALGDRTLTACLREALPPPGAAELDRLRTRAA